MLSIFSWVSWPSVCLPGEMSIKVFCPFFDWAVCFIDIELHELFVYFLQVFFLSEERSSLKIFKVSLLATNLLVSPPMKISFFHIHSLKIFSLDIKFWIVIILPSGLWWKSHFSQLLQKFFLYLLFSPDYYVSRHDFIWV